MGSREMGFQGKLLVELNLDNVFEPGKCIIYGDDEWTMKLGYNY